MCASYVGCSTLIWQSMGWVANAVGALRVQLRLRPSARPTCTPRRVAPGPETKCDTFTYTACVSRPYVPPCGHHRPRPTMVAHPKGRERLVHHRRPHARCCTAACASRRIGQTGSESGGSAAGAPVDLGRAYLSPQHLLRRQKEGAQRV